LTPGTDEEFKRFDQWVVDRVYGTLAVADALLRRLEIPYSIIGGTLLGAVRHGGLIPWDDDGDVYIRTEHLERLVGHAQPFLSANGFGMAFDDWASFKVFPLDGRTVEWHARVLYPFTDIFPMSSTFDGRLVFHYGVAVATWPSSFLLIDEFDTLTDYRFGPLRLRGIGLAGARRYCDSAYGPEWENEAYQMVDHVRARDHPKKIVRLVTRNPALPTPGILTDWAE
jgi:lipopolysaccharide cholinephosphotransferase